MPWDDYGEYFEDLSSVAVLPATADIGQVFEVYGPPAPYVDMQAEADYQARLAADLAASSQAGLQVSAGADYAARLAADFARLGLSATGTVLSTAQRSAEQTTAAAVQKTNAAILSASLPAPRRVAEVSSSFKFSWQEAAIAALVVFAGYKVAQAL